MDHKWALRFLQRVEDYNKLCEEIMALGVDGTPFPPYPIKVFGHVTTMCILGGYCYHRVYETHDTSTSKYCHLSLFIPSN